MFDTFAAQWPPIHGFLENPLYLGHQGFDLARRSTGRDHEDVRDDEQVRNIQEENIKTLLVADSGRGS